MMAAHQIARGGEKNGPFWLFNSTGKGTEVRNCMMDSANHKEVWNRWKKVGTRGVGVQVSGCHGKEFKS